MAARVGLALAVAVCTAVAGTAAGAPGPARWEVTYVRETAAQGSGGMTAFPDGTVWANVIDRSTDHIVVVRSRDFGATWQEVPRGRGLGPDYVFGLAMGTPRRGWAVALAPPRTDDKPPPYGPTLLHTGDAAASWSRTPLPKAPGAASFTLEGIRSSPTGRSAVVTGWSLDEAGRFMPGRQVIWAGDGGRTLRRTTLGGSGTSLTIASVLDDRTAAAVVEEVREDPSANVPGSPCCWGHSAAVYVTTDAGRTWERRGTLREAAYSVDWVRPDRLVVAGAWTGEVFVSRDGGRRFGRVGRVGLVPYTMNPAQMAGVQVDFVTPEVGYAVTCDSGMWRTTDGGESWDLEPSPNHGGMPACSLHAIAAADPEHAVAWHHSGLTARRTG